MKAHFFSHKTNSNFIGIINHEKNPIKLINVLRKDILVHDVNSFRGNFLAINYGDVELFDSEKWTCRIRPCLGQVIPKSRSTNGLGKDLELPTETCAAQSGLCLG
jgi:hypothetical protein